MSDAPDTSAAVSGRPLAGISVLVTRTRAQSSALADPLEALGAEVVAMPVIKVAEPLDTRPLQAAIAQLSSYDWLVLTSTNGVERFFARLQRDSGTAAERLAGVRLAAVGSATAASMRFHGLEPDLVPKDFRAEGLAEAFGELGIGPGTRILIPRAAEAREVLPDELRAQGAQVDAVDLYRLVSAEPSPWVLNRLAAGEIDVITFASGATARHFVSALEKSGLDPTAVLAATVVASVGPVTTAGIRKLGFDVDIEAPESTMESLVVAIAERFGGSART